MNKTIFEISKMDCPSEENLIRMKLEGLTDIKKLDFDIAARGMTVYHKGSNSEIEQKLIELNLGAKIIFSGKSEQKEFSDYNPQRKILFTVLGINLSFFILEMLTGIISQSMGLVADSLDMLADSLVYGISLWAVGSTLVHKKIVARIAGYLQIVLASLGFLEIIRRLVLSENIPGFSTMIIVSILALVANGISLAILQKSKNKEEVHIKASMLFTSNDILINLGVIIAGVLVHVFSSNIPDLTIGLIVFVLVLQGAFRILKLSK